MLKEEGRVRKGVHGERGEFRGGSSEGEDGRAGSCDYDEEWEARGEGLKRWRRGGGGGGMLLVGWKLEREEGELVLFVDSSRTQFFSLDLASLANGHQCMLLPRF